MTDVAGAGTAPSAGAAALPPTADLVHAAQWAAIRSWVDTVPRTVRELPSALPDWTIDHLLSHLARSVDAIAGLRPAPESVPEAKPVPEAEPVPGAGSVPEPASVPEPGSPPLSVAQYLTGYAGRLSEMSERTITAAAASAADRGGELDAAYAQARRTLSALGADNPIVTAPGGPIRLDDFLETRIVELVVHGADLTRSLAKAGEAAAEIDPPPVLDAAVERAAVVLYRAFRDTAGTPADDTTLGRLGAAEFVDVLSGRVPPPKKIPAAVRAKLPLF